MRLIDAEKLEEDLKKYLKTQEEAAEHYNITDGTYVKLQRGVIFTVLEMVQAQPTVPDNNAELEKKMQKLRADQARVIKDAVD